MPKKKTRVVKKAAKKVAKNVAKKVAKKVVSKARSSTAPKATTKSASPSGLLEVGARAPDFRARDGSGRVVTRASLSGKPFVLFFYPQDDTPGCTVEACAFRDNRPKFAKLGCPVLGVSPDSVESHRAFDAKHRLGLTLLADEPGADGVPPIAGAYGVWQEKNMYGRRYMGIVRTTYVVASDGTVAARFDRVKVDGHAEEVLAALRRLPKRGARS